MQLASNSEIRDGQVAELIPQLLDRLVVLGDLARQISHALGGNGHYPELSRESVKKLADHLK